MADREQLRILLEEGVEAWNEWKKNNPDRNIDLTGAYLTEANLSGADLSEANLTEAKLTGTNLTGAYLTEANLSRADLTEAKLTEAKLSRANLSRADLSRAYLTGADLFGAYLTGTNLTEAKLTGANLTGAYLTGTNLTEAKLTGANLSRADLTGAKLTGANLSRADLTGADLSGTNLTGTNLTGADLFGAYLTGTNLTGTNLTGTNLSGANLTGTNLTGTNLSGADLTGADLSGANLTEADLTEADLTEADLTEADLTEADLTGADLTGADLTGADLTGADLSGTNLTEANLSGTNLSVVQALRTNFSSATLTGACIEDWHINSETNFEEVICDYIYLKKDRQERRPSDPNRNFAPGDFAKLVQKSIETVDLIFNEGIDWKAFLSSYQGIQVEYGDQNVSIQAIEKKSDDAFVIRLSVPPEADKAKIEHEAKRLYETQLQVLEADNHRLLQHNASLENIVNTLASRPIIVEAKAVAEKDNTSYEFHAPVGSVDNKGTQTNVTGVVEGDQIGTQYNSPQEKTLAEAAGEIQKLLQQLEQTNPTATVEQQKAYVDAAISPTLKQRFVGALTSGGETAIEEFLDNPYVNVGKAIVKGWIKPD